MRILLYTARNAEMKKNFWLLILWKCILIMAIFFLNQRTLNRLLQMANKKLHVLFLCVKIVVMNLRTTARFPRPNDLTLTSLWSLFPGYFLLVLLPAVTCLFPKLCAPTPNTFFQPHWDTKDCDQVQVFVLKSTCKVTCIVRTDPLKARNLALCFHWSRIKPFSITQLDHQPVPEAAALSCGLSGTCQEHVRGWEY